NQVVKSRKIPIAIPSFGGFGMFGGFGAAAGLGSMLAGGGLRGLTGMAGLAGGGRLAGLGGMPGIGGVSGMAGLGGLSRISGFGGVAGIGGVGGRGQLGALNQFLPAQNYSVHADPQGTSTNGFLTLWNNPRVDTHLAYKVTGKRVAVGFSGNHYFHPFAWDAIHMFELDYDDEGRVRHAWELDEPNAPRLDFN